MTFNRILTFVWIAVSLYFAGGAYLGGRDWSWMFLNAIAWSYAAIAEAQLARLRK